MHLIKAHITNFRSAEDSEEFRIDPVTCFVGKNEAGKSAILLALASLNPHPATPVSLDKERDYPRRYLTQYDQRHPHQQAIAVSTTWQLTEEELGPIEAEFGAGALRAREIKIIRRYGANTPEWLPDIDFPKILDHLSKKLGLDDAERPVLKGAVDSKELLSILTNLPTPTDNQKKLLEQLKSYPSVEAKAQALLQGQPRKTPHIGPTVDSLPIRRYRQ